MVVYLFISKYVDNLGGSQLIKQSFAWITWIRRVAAAQHSFVIHWLLLCDTDTDSDNLVLQYQFLNQWWPWCGWTIVWWVLIVREIYHVVHLGKNTPHDYFIQEIKMVLFSVLCKLDEIESIALTSTSSTREFRHLCYYWP